MPIKDQSGRFSYKLLENSTAEITGCTGEQNDLHIPTRLDGYTVTSIGYSAFSECHSLTSVTIPDSVTSIGDNAFCDCGKVVLVVAKGSFAERWADGHSVQYTLADS